MAITNSMASNQFGMHAQEEMMRQRYWEEQQRRMASMYYDDNRNAFAVPREQAAGKEVPKPAPKLATPDPLAFMDNKANKVLLTQGEM
jgi:hypothetical protein